MFGFLVSLFSGCSDTQVVEPSLSEKVDAATTASLGLFDAYCIATVDPLIERGAELKKKLELK